MEQATKLHCIIDGIEVVAIKAAERVWGRGEPAPYKHVADKDEDGVPFCGKVTLNLADVEPDSDAEA